MSKQVLKTWTVGKRRVALMQSGAIRIVDSTYEDAGFVGTDSTTDYTLATGLAGLIGLRDVLTGVIDEVKRQRGITP